MADDKEKFAPLIARLVPINELPTAVQNDVINRCELIKVRKGGHVFKQGDRDGFSYYLLDGEIDLIANGQQHGTIVSGTDRARHAMAQLQPRQFAAKAVKSSIVMQVVRDYLDKMMVVHQKEEPAEDVTNYDLASAEVEVEELHAADDVDWMTKMLQSELFSKMPTANIQSLFALLEPVEFLKGDVVIRQGEPGEHYFIIQEGHCNVLRASMPGGREVKLADLGPGDSFGEEALITDTPRNATVVMATNGVLMRLEKEKFIELIKKPTLRGVNFDQAVSLVIDGAQWLDVRFKNEYDQGAIRDCLHIPLNVLRLSFDKLNPSKPYVVYCDTGGRSSAAAFLLAERGFKVWYLQGGLTNNPKASEVLQTPEQEGTMIEAPPPASARAAEPKPAPKPAPPPPPPAPPPPPPPAPSARKGRKQEPVEDDEKLDPAIKASVLETELARTNHQLEEMERQRKEIMDQAKKAAQAEVARRLQAERDKIEAAKREAEEQAKQLRAEEEERIRRMKEEAEARLQAEKKKLEEVYSRNAEEMEKLQRLKQEADEQMRRERERVEQEAERARREMEDVQKIKQQFEAAKKAMEAEAEERRRKHDEMEREIQKKAREKLEVERRKLAEQFSRNNQELEQARNERAAADAARDAAKDEAAKIIAEYKAKHDATRLEEEARLQAERRKLEEEQRKIREMLEQSERARREAEQTKAAAAEEVERLRARASDDEVTSSSAARDTLDSEIRAAEERLTRARREAEAAEEERERAEAARRLNEEDLVKRYEIEEETRKALEQDLDQFKEQLAQEEKKFASISSQMEHMRRIKKRADEAKVATQQHTDSLLSDVASQLRKGE